MKISLSKHDQGQGEWQFEISVPFVEQQKYLKQAAQRLTVAKPIRGFRPGKAPYETLLKHLGGENILNEALETLVSVAYFQVLQDEKIQAIGQPQIEITKQAFGNELTFKATIAQLPTVQLGDFSAVKITKQEVKVTAEEVDKALTTLRNMRAQETVVDREARQQDLVEVDFQVTIDKVPIEGGTAQKYQLVLGDQQMIPGFEEQIIGWRAGQEKIFKLKFPKDYKKDLADKEADFKVKLLAVRERKLPAADDEFAKLLGQKDLASLKAQIKQNLLQEEEFKESQRQEIEMLNILVEKSEFGPIPKILLTNELHRMTHELEDELQSRGIKYEDYLRGLGKTKETLEQELEPKALIRVKTALLSRQIAEQENIKASAAEVDKELELTKQQYKDNPEVRKNLGLPEYREYLTNILSNRKVIEWLKKQIIK